MTAASGSTNESVTEASRRRPRDSALGPLKFLLVAALVLPVALYLGFAIINYREAQDNAAHDLRRVSQVAREHAVKVLTTEVQVAARVNELVSDMSARDIRSSEGKLHDAMDRIVASLPDISGLLVLGEDGHPLVSSAIMPVPASDLSDRDFFSGIHSGYEGTFVSRLQRGAVTGQRFFGLSRAWTGPDGTKKGVIVVGTLPAIFQDFYAAIMDSGMPLPGQVVTLVRSDGQIILRYPPIDGPPPRIAPGNPFLLAIAKNPDSGTYDNRSVIDAGSPDRLFVYERVPGFPLYVVAGRSRDVIVSGWLHTIESHLVFGVPATLGLFLITLMALRRTREKEDALALTRAEMRRREAAEAALMQRQRLDAVGEMTGGLAHDFNNLLTIIIGNLELISRRTQEPAVKRLASNAMIAGQRGADVTQKLLAFSRRQFVSPEVVDLNERLEEFRPLFDQAARPVVIELVLDSESAAVMLDPGQLETAILNLVANARDAIVANARDAIVANARDAIVANARGEVVANARGEVVANARGEVAANARGEVAANARGEVVANARGEVVANARDAMADGRDAMPGEGRITIATTHLAIDEADRPDLSAGEYVRISVSDTGPGMDRATAARAFEPFFTTKDVGAGTGLGLSQVYGFARQAGGDARIVSPPGGGTTVEIMLPRTEAPPPRPQMQPNVGLAGPDHEGDVILVVEDEPALLDLTVETLRELGYATLSANNAEAALALLRGSERIDVLFTDMIMPGGMNGLQLSNEARRLRPGLKLLLTSGYAPTIFGQNVPDDVPLITKPYDQDKLATQLRAVLRA